jgi:hypothetical protein
VDFRKDSEGICKLYKGFIRHLWTSEGTPKTSIDFRKDSEGICGLQKGLRHQFYHNIKNWKKEMIFGFDRMT